MDWLGTVVFVLLIGYEVGFPATGRKTFGRAWTGTRLVTDGTHAPAIGWAKASLRTAVLYGPVIAASNLGGDWAGLGSFLALWPIVLIIVMLVEPKRRALHDLAAGTVVLRD